MDTFADYEIVEPMSTGNHGDYFRAVTPARLGIADEFVALKVLGSRAQDDDFRRVSNELRLLHSLQSDFLVELLDAGSADGRLFLVTRYYPTGPLGQVDNIAPTTALQVLADAARGTDALHEVGVTHRDIHPDNILIDNGRGRLADLGLASMLVDETTGVGPIGSLEYIDPMVIRGNAASRRTDIWSLGVSTHKVFTGVGLFGEIPGSNILDACRHVLHTAPSLDPSLDPEIAAVVSKAIAPDPTDRYTTAAEFAADLTALIQPPKGTS